MLEGLSATLFETIESVSEQFLTLKTVFLLAIYSIKIVGDVGVPKVPTNVPRPIVLQAFSPPAFRNQDQEKFNLLFPVRALDAYVHRAVMWRKSDQLFVCFGSSKKGYPALSSLLACG